MMIAPPHASGLAVVDLVVQTTRLWGQLLLTPLMWTTPVPLTLAPPPAAQPAPAADAERLTALAAADAPLTDHALLVLLGQFAQHLGLLTLLEAVPIAQKQVRHTPQAKLIAFLAAILAGGEHLQDLNDAAAPLSADPSVAAAWGQVAFAHCSGVSRSLAACHDESPDGLLAAL